MASNQVPPNPIQHYQKAVEILTTNIAALRQSMERPDMSPDEKKATQKQENDYQNKLIFYQTLLNNMNPQIAANKLQQRMLAQASAASTPSTPSMIDGSAPGVSSAPGSPSPYATQPHNAAAFSAAQLRNAAQQQVMTKMGLTGTPTSPQTGVTSSPRPLMSAAPNAVLQSAKPGMLPANAANNMFSFPAMAMPPTSGNNTITKPVSMSSLDMDGNVRVLAKRKIQELVGQIDPNERLEPEVEDILLEIADEFIESVTSFACRLAKHRKSDTLEVKDLQLHLERNWNIRIPGFASDDIRPLRKPVIPQSHQSKVQAVNLAKSQTSSTSGIRKD
ncbi:Transcription initiation factor TFIID subunit 12 [Apophysomyces sp. BC1034]|nr:Transcription initiation factor TFIID subunit 12 [Apophysomyces sp. BC1015]KAG0182814.1 Transcription initiation factor TFIID subunit 12 [Apophysomyces sp. BC1021]KAG0193441.1 Transcription initiation factor TFIID subunit 12 [Apophysomyces sp. BC1034]